MSLKIASTCRLVLCSLGAVICAFGTAASPEASSPKDSGALSIALPTEGADACPKHRIYRVTKLVDDGSRGTLRHALHVDSRNARASRKKSCRKIVFDVQGDIVLRSPMTIRSDHVTVDGCTAPGSGITITQESDQPYGLIIDGTHRHTHDVILQCLRFRGVHDKLLRHRVGEAMLSVDGDCASTRTPCSPEWQQTGSKGGVSRLAIDRIIYTESTDKLTLWGKVKDTSITRSFFYHNPLALLISFYNGPTDLQRRNILVSRNIFADNNERNPQLRGWIDGIDIRHNIVAGWDAYPPLPGQDAYFGDGYGIRIKNPPGERSVNANIIGNIFLSAPHNKHRALIYGIRPGPDADEGATAGCLQQGQLFEGSQMGKLYVKRNFIGSGNCDHYSTIDKPLSLPFMTEPLAHQTLCHQLPNQIGVPSLSKVEREILTRVNAQCSNLLKLD